MKIRTTTIREIRLNHDEVRRAIARHITEVSHVKTSPRNIRFQIRGDRNPRIAGVSVNDPQGTLRNAALFGISIAEACAEHIPNVTPADVSPTFSRSTRLGWHLTGAVVKKTTKTVG